MIRRLLPILAALATLGAPAPADPAPPPVPADLVSYLAAQGYQTLPVQTLGQSRQILTARLNGQFARFIVDTGCERTQIDRPKADALGLRVRDTRMFGMSVGGRIKGWVGIASLDSFRLGDDELNGGQQILVMPKGGVMDSTADGLFGYDLMHQNGFIIPVGAHSLWYKTVGAPTDSIDSYLLKLGYRPTALDYVKGGLRLQSHLNGQAMNVVVDCGAPRTAFNADFVTRTCGLDLRPLAFTIHGLDGRETKGYSFLSRDLFFGTLRVPPTPFTACHAPIFDYSKMDALLGYDFLAAHQAVIDLGQNVIWMR